MLQSLLEVSYEKLTGSRMPLEPPSLEAYDTPADQPAAASDDSKVGAWPVHGPPGALRMHETIMALDLPRISDHCDHSSIRKPIFLPARLNRVAFRCLEP